MELESGTNPSESGCPMAINLKELVQDDDAGIQMGSECPLTGEKVKHGKSIKQALAFDTY